MGKPAENEVDNVTETTNAPITESSEPVADTPTVENPDPNPVPEPDKAAE